MRVRISGLSGLAPHDVQEWEQLAAQAHGDNPFVEAGFALAAARHLPEGGAAQLLTVHDDDGLALVLPVRRRSTWRRLPPTVLTGWQHEYSFLGTPLVRPGSEAVVWTATINALRRSRPAAVLLLPTVRADAPATRGLREAAADLGVRCDVVERHERAVVRHRGDGSYFDGLRGVHRKGLRRQRRLLARAGGAVATFDRTGDPEAVEVFLRLEAAGWKGRAGTAMAVRSGDAQLLREVQRRWPDRVHLMVLMAGERPLAAQVNLRAGRTMYCFKTAYDEQVADASPGVLLMMDVIAACHADPDVELLDSCAAPGHSMADRLLPDRSEVQTLVLSLSGPGATGYRSVVQVGRQLAGLRNSAWWPKGAA